MDPMLILAMVLTILGTGVGWYLRGKTQKSLPQRPLDEQLATLGLNYLNAANAAKQNPNAQHGEEKRLRDASKAFYAAVDASRQSLKIKELEFL